MRLFLFVSITVIAALLNGCQAVAPVLEHTDTVSAALSVVADIPFAGAASDVLADDFDGDGRSDIAFTAHAENYTQVFYQHTPRHFAPGPRVDAVGFHPGDLLRLPVQNRSLFLMSAEGNNNLLIMEPTPKGSLAVVASRTLSQPLSATAFHWPGWGLGLAVAPKSKSTVVLLKGLDPLTGRDESAMELPLPHNYIQVGRIAAADFDGDGSDELVFATSLTSEVWIIRAPKNAGESPRIEPLWRNPHGGRARQVLPADINGDGYTDLLVPDETGQDGAGMTAISVLLNDQHGQLHFAYAFPFSSSPEKEGGIPGIRGLDFGRDKDGIRYLFGAGYQSFVLYRFPANWAGGKPEMRTLKLQQIEGVHKVLLRDLDGDGWLDAVVARGKEQDAGLILYGPLWDNFAKLAEKGIPVH
jgi:hypothetical protein